MNNPFLPVFTGPAEEAAKSIGLRPFIDYIPGNYTPLDRQKVDLAHLNFRIRQAPWTA